MKPKINVIDLDGTLLNTNTFHKWMFFLLKKSFLNHPQDSLKLIYIALLRLVKQITHTQMKYKILQISEAQHYQKYIDDFVGTLDIYLNKEVLKFIKNDDTINILATAAPELYAKNIAKLYGFEFCLATPSTNTKHWYENIRDNKKNSLLTLMNSMKIDKVDIVITDHHDDIPIMLLAKSVILVNSSFETKNSVSENQQLKSTKITIL
jgi:phosphoserine phosphatase